MPGASPPVATPLSSAVSCWLSIHHLRASWIDSLGRRMPASWQERRPRAAYWLLELSPVAGPSFIFLTGILVFTFGFSLRPGWPNSRTLSRGWAGVATAVDGPG